MTPTTSAVLCRYRYDPLDRLASTSPAGQGAALRFYCKSRLATHIQGAIRHTIFGHDEQLLAQQKHSVTGYETSLLATDQPGSVLHGVSGAGIESAAYSTYGYSDAENGLDCLMGFNGELRDPVSGHYLLGNGYRAFNPVLMRFNSPDSLSPFAAGGINSYAYCEGDPMNKRDPTGHSGKWSLIKVLSRILTLGRSATSNSRRLLDQPAGKLERSQSLVQLASPKSAFDMDKTLIGFHGSTLEDGKSLMQGLNPSYMNSSAGLSSGRGFYVAPTRTMASDFAEVAANYKPGSTPAVYTVHMSHYPARMPGRDYRFGTMGEGGLGPRGLGDMELVIKEHLYRAISIRHTEAGARLTLPRASEAPF